MDARPQWIDPQDWTEDDDLQALAEPSSEIMVRAPGDQPRRPAPKRTTSVQIVNNPRRPKLDAPELDPDTDGETQTGDIEPRWAAVPAPDQSPQYPSRLPAPAPRTPPPPPRAQRGKTGAPMGMVAALGLTSVAFAAVGLFAAIVVVWSFAQGGGAEGQPNPLQRIGLAIQERLRGSEEEGGAEAAVEAPVAPPAPVFDEVALQPTAPIVAPKTAAAPKPAPTTAATVTTTPRSAPPAPAVSVPPPLPAPRSVQPRAPVRDEETAALDTFLLIVRAEAEGVQVEIDGRPVGAAPAKASVAPGKHRLRLWSNGVASDLLVDVKGDPFEVCFDGKGRSIRKVDCK